MKLNILIGKVTVDKYTRYFLNVPEEYGGMACYESVIFYSWDELCAFLKKRIEENNGKRDE